MDESVSSKKQATIEMEENLDLGMDMEVYEPSYSWLCCTHYKDRSKFQNLLLNIDLSPVQKQIIRTRYINILENLQKRARNYGIMFYLGHIIITVGSLFVPALLSIQNSDKSYVYENIHFSIHIYWTTFILSLCVTIFNGILTLFKIDKSYYFLNTTLERFRTEGWQYFSLTGRYAGDLLKRKKKDTPVKPTYRNQFLFFMHHVERFKMKQVEEEYYKTDERSAHAPNQANAMSSINPFNGMVPNQGGFSPSPGNLLDLQKNVIPQAVQATVNGMQNTVNEIVRSHTTAYPVQLPSSTDPYLQRQTHEEDDDDSDTDHSKSSNGSSNQDSDSEEVENVIIIPSTNNPLFQARKHNVHLDSSNKPEENPNP